MGGTMRPNLFVMQPHHGPSRMRSRREGPRRGGMRWWSLSEMRVSPPTHKGKAPTPSPKPSKVAKAPPPPPRHLTWGPSRPVWPPTCRTLGRLWSSKRLPRGRWLQWPRAGRPTASRPCPRPRRSKGKLSVPWTGRSTWPTRGGGSWRR